MRTPRFHTHALGPFEMASRVALIASVATVIVLSFANPWVFAADDSLFYLVVAQHISTDGAWTFNGLIPTNGVQPLWQLATAGVVTVAGFAGLDSPVAQLRALFALNWALALVALVQLWRLLTRLRVSEPYRLMGVVVLGGCLCGPWGMFASEAHLVAVTLLWLLLTVEQKLDGHSGTAIAIATGCASGLMMLSRLDTVWVAAMALICLVVFSTETRRWQRVVPVLLSALTATALLVPYLAWNVVSFGHVTPISGAIKVDVSSPRFAIDGIGLFGVVMLGAIWAGGALSVLRAPRQRTRLAIWLVPAVGATLSSAFYVAFSRGPFTQWFWYFIPHAVALALTAPLLATSLAGRYPSIAPRAAASARLGCVALALGSVAFCTVRYVLGPPDSLWADARSFSADVSEVLPEGAAVATVDMPGVLGFVSGHPVVALDGLTGDFEFQNALRDNGMACTLDALGVRYLITVDNRATVGRDRGSVTLSLSSWLHREQQTELRGRDPLLTSPDGRYSLWHLEQTCQTRD